MKMNSITRNSLTGLAFSVLSLPVLAQSVYVPKPAEPAQAVSPSYGSGSSYSVTGDFDHGFKDQDMKSKEVSKEISVSKGADIYIENASRGIVIKTWDQPKVKVTTTVYYSGDAKLSDDEWLDKVNLSLRTLGSSVKIKSGSIGGNTLFYSYNSSASGVAVFNGSGQHIGTNPTMKRLVTVTVPAGSKLDVESKYAEVTLDGSIGDANVDISNGSLEAENLHKLILRSRYSNVNVGDVKTAEVEFTNGRFSAKNIDDLDIDSKYSTVEMAMARKLVIRSTNDEFEVEEAGEVRGRKTYGNLRITRLTGSIDIDGSNADLKIRNVAPSVSLVKIDDRYADIRIPLKEVKNFAIDFSGPYSSVYGNFEKKPVAVVSEVNTANSVTTSITINGDALRAPAARNGGTLSSAGRWDDGPAKFTASSGDGKGLKIEMKCQNCTVDFK